MPDQEQNFSNHTRWYPAYHFVAGPILFFNAGWAVYRLFGGVSFEAILNLLVAIALVMRLRAMSDWILWSSYSLSRESLP